MQALTLSIIKQIIKSSKEQEIPIPAKTRLIKLLYLIEIEHYKHLQKRLTNLRWQFYHYGPYAPEIEHVLGSPDIEEITFSLRDGKQGSHYDLAEDEGQNNLPPELKRLIDHTVKDWGEIDLNKLLDHVYFETEPMITAKRGDLIDFTTVRPWTPSEETKTIRLDAKKLSALRNKYIAHIKEKSQTRPVFHIPDKTYIDCLKAWDEDVSATSLSGQVIIKLADHKKEE